MEGPHSQLRSRLTNRLRGNNAHRFTEVNHRASREIAAVALHTDTEAAGAGQDRPNLHAFDARIFHGSHTSFNDFFATHEEQLARQRIMHIFESGSAKNTLSERLNDLARFDERCSLQCVFGSTILLADDHVLRHINQASC